MVILPNDFDGTNIDNIKALYRQTYYPVAIQLLNKGMTESDIKANFRKAVIYFYAQQKRQSFDQNLDIVLYLLTLCLLDS